MSIHLSDLSTSNADLSAGLRISATEDGSLGGRPGDHNNPSFVAKMKRGTAEIGVEPSSCGSISVGVSNEIDCQNSWLRRVEARVTVAGDSGTGLRNVLARGDDTRGVAGRPAGTFKAAGRFITRLDFGESSDLARTTPTTSVFSLSLDGEVGAEG